VSLDETKSNQLKYALVLKKSCKEPIIQNGRFQKGKQPYCGKEIALVGHNKFQN
jgi:hypothetical protein